MIRTPGINGVPGKVTLEVVLAHADVLDGDEPLPWLVLHHGVHERRGKPVAESIDCFGDAEGHGWVVYQLSAISSRLSASLETDARS